MLMAGALETRNILRQLSNFCCLPGRTGGSPVVLGLHLQAVEHAQHTTEPLARQTLRVSS